MPTIWQISLMLRPVSHLNAKAAFFFFSSTPLGRPPLLPRARAAVSPAWVRSRIMSRSNSASEAKIWKMSLPPENEIEAY